MFFTYGVTLILNVVIFTIVWFIDLSVTLHCVIVCDYLIILMSILNESMKYYLLNCIPLVIKCYLRARLTSGQVFHTRFNTFFSSNVAYEHQVKEARILRQVFSLIKMPSIFNSMKHSTQM